GVRKCTGMPADVYGLKGKGYIRVGCDADMVLFDPDTIIDRADYADPYKNNEGIHMVFVGGQAAVVDNELTGVRNGKILRRA
ncbi:MAG: amidohydrolase family protein, partial [Clostridia bacterium]|nr:amidohydrolase family protein [Clostridia bacterium]